MKLKVSKEINKIKSPLSGYFGGKQRLSKTICEMIPDHNVYVEPFFGGGSVFFSKKKSKIEVINDIDNNLYRFWKVCQTDSHELSVRFKNLLYFESEFKRALRVLKKEEEPKDEIDFAYCYFLSVQMSFAGGSDSFAYIKKGQYPLHPQRIKAKVMNMKFMFIRLDNVYIFNRDVLKIIKIYSKEKDVFFYLDPPYPETEQKYKNKYNIDCFNNLCEYLKNIQGKFILSCYNNEEFNLDKNWKIKEIDFTTRFHTNKKNMKRNETLIYNF